ncbi:MAG: anti-sigma factor [Gemmatimonadaceae bacterium]
MSTERDIGKIVRDNLPRYQAPQSLRDFVRANAPSEDVPPAILVARRRPRAAREFLYAAGIVIAFLAGWVINNSIRSRQQASAATEAMVAELVDNHVRSLIGDHLTDVRSTDQHTVKPWFNGKIDFAPRVVDLAPQGFPLIGGRVDYIRGHTAAALVYGRRKHFVNVFIWPAGSTDVGDTSRQYNGYSLLHWVTDGLSYWAVTDAAPVDLTAFRQGYTTSR